MTRPLGPSGRRDEPIRGWGERLPTGNKPDVPDPSTGGPLIIAGLLIGIGAVMPWADIPVLPLTPTGLAMGLGWAYVVSALLAFTAGALVLARRGTAAAATALVVGALAFILSVLAAASIPPDQAARHDVLPTDVTIGIGLWLAMGGTALMTAGSALALARRNTDPAG